MQEIAVHRDKDGKATDFNGPGLVALYRFDGQGWSVVREMPLCVDMDMGLGALHRVVGAIMDFLGECRVFLVGAKSGVTARVLEHYGVSVWEYDSDPEALLDFVRVQLELEAARIRERNRIWLAPQDKGDGHYSISLLGSQAKTSGLTSKQMLEGFLHTTVFKTLEVFCSHMPPWMEAECTSGRLTCRKEQVNADELRLVFSPAR